MKHICCYYRVSTDKQELVSQRDSVEQFLRELPRTERPESVRIFQDEGRSGKDDNRPGFQTMLKEALLGKFDTIVCYRLDRFTRSANTAIRTILELDAKGVAFVATSQPILNLGHSNPFRRTMLAAFAEIAEIERETTVARIKAGLEAARRRGVILGNQPLSEEQKKTIITLYLAGNRPATIKKMIRVGRTSVYRVLKEADLLPPSPTAVNL